ncbi:MAG: hypothetical protein KC910_22745 [Candidatus Eremiobacteraeota bacterium]|nr:hypothetical protein [Candidatus Eremiobacteraeota bacterium]
MRYYRYCGSYGTLGAGDVYMEVEDGFVRRQVEIAGSQIVSSNLELIFPEGAIDYDELEQVLGCTQDDFEMAWAKNLERSRDRWTAIKKRFPAGTRVHGVIRMYGHGVIVSFGCQTYGRLDYDECMAAAGPGITDPIWHPCSVVVSGYDEENQWLVFGSPKFLGRAR